MSSSSPEELLKTAEKRASSSSGWFSSGSAKLEEAAELFKAAGNKFRLANRFDEAGQAFMRAADTEIKAGETDYAANTFFEAHKCFKMARPESEHFIIEWIDIYLTLCNSS
jgi:alpha-soluble NSF attachment protein